MPKDLMPSDWLRILTNANISAQDIALVEQCDIKRARRIVVHINGQHTPGNPYICPTDSYLTKYRGTTRATEIKNIYGDKHGNCN